MRIRAAGICDRKEEICRVRGDTHKGLSKL
nr:MAG TPA: hypothetical protein [Caudoviricetes sp.]